MLAIGAGAKGLIFWGYEVEPYAMAEDTYKWKNLSKAVARFQSRSLLWLAQTDSSLISADSTNPKVKIFTYTYEKAVITYAINATDTEQNITLNVSPQRTPFCWGTENQDTVLHLQRETSIELSLDAYDIRILQFAEASNPGGEK